MKDKDFFNSIAPDWDKNNDSSTPEKINTVLDYAQISDGQHILDIGTGTGILLPFLAGRIGEKGEIVAIDAAERMLELAELKYSSLSPCPHFILTDIEKEKVAGRFDRIMLYCVFPHIHHPETTLRRLADDNLAPGGKIIIAHPTSRRFINDVHHRRPIHSEGLASGEEISRRLAKVGLHTDIIEDSERLYVLSITPSN